ncbi:TBC1 domain family member 2B-like isoform X2 [Anneissia japonica]|uniref:TBC1 domain family member 2B-like isoform X1 n=1 Tax=Anneissia japonica TaxID=1529436 RepID=UPI0014254BBE|nr:TBC1 domain family member 2B-like isoform X1 [Anneissia japonica]XP_033124013.1 TBC1 domain family member 2B-like isoform X2 [Anneissia japonica]
MASRAKHNTEVPTGVLVSIFDDTISQEVRPSHCQQMYNEQTTGSAHEKPSRATTTDNNTNTIAVSLGLESDDTASTALGSAMERAGDGSQVVGTSDDVRLCGFLSKQGDRGLIRPFRTRWFVFDQHTCRLYYYRTKQDLLPLGHIDISNASFTFDVGCQESGQFNFDISSDGRQYHLQANDRHTMMYWLQELQEKRRQFSLLQTCLARTRSNHKDTSKQYSTTGLVSTQRSKAAIQIGSQNQSQVYSQILNPLEPPKHSVGEAATQSNPNVGMFNTAFSNLRSQMSQISLPSRKRTSSGQETIVTSKRGSGIDFQTSTEMEPATTEGQRAKSKEGFMSNFRRKTPPVSKSSSLTSSSPSLDSACGKCQQLQNQISSLVEESEAMENEFKAKQELITVLHQQLTAASLEKATSFQFLECKTDQEKLMILQRKNKQLVQLEQLLEELNSDRDAIKEQFRTCELEVKGLKEQVNMFQELVMAKDEIVMSLTSRVQELENRGPVLATYTNSVVDCNKTSDQGNGLDVGSDFSSSVALATSIDHPIPQSLVNLQELDKLKDSLQAYETQNKFLNKEILELNQLRANDSLREKSLIYNKTELEANYCRINSKYLLLLKELKTPQRDGVPQADDIISRLLQEAIDGDVSAPVENTKSDLTRFEEYDEYGFSITAEGDNEDTLSSRAAQFQRRSDEISAKMRDLEISLSVKWENYFVNLGDRELVKTAELKALVRQGIPHEFRANVWKGCVDSFVKKDREKFGLGYYMKLLDTKKYQRSPAAKQIELDLLRTLPTNKHYLNMDSDGIPKLRKVLLAYSVHNPMIGYCQGLNRLAALALLYLNEEDAFWCMVAIIERIMPPDYYSKTLIGSQTDQRVFKELLSEKIPRLNAHLDRENVDLSLVTFNWFITIFCDNIPAETMLRVWDTFLFEGNKVLFRFALAFFKYHEEKLLQMTGYIDIFNFLRQMPSTMTDIKSLSQIAFYELNPFPRRLINNKRQFHRTQVLHELEELDAIREEFVVSRPNAVVDGVMSDEEDEYTIIDAMGN